jgi:hypothetical protein
MADVMKRNAMDTALLTDRRRLRAQVITSLVLGIVGKQIYGGSASSRRSCWKFSHRRCCTPV